MNSSLPGLIDEWQDDCIIEARDALFADCILGSCVVVKVIDDVQPSALIRHISCPWRLTS